MAEKSLDEILSAEYEDEDLPETEDTEETGETEAEAPEDVPPTSEPKKAPDPEQFKGYIDERLKRQALEKELADLRASQTPAKKIDPLEDPEGFQSEVDKRIRAAEFNLERKFMAKVHHDWEEAETWINEQLGSNSAIQAKLSGSSDILEDAYKMYQNHKALERLGGVDQLQKELEETKAKLAALEAGPVVKPKTPNKPSLAITGTSTGVDTEGFQSLEDVLGRDFNNR